MNLSITIFEVFLLVAARWARRAKTYGRLAVMVGDAGSTFFAARDRRHPFLHLLKEGVRVGGIEDFVAVHHRDHSPR